MSQRVRIEDNPIVAVRTAADVMRRGGIVIFPTETYYGIGTDPANEEAVKRLCAIKDRSATKPVPLIAANFTACERLAPIPEIFKPLCAAFWPGPLTIALEPYASWPTPLLGGGKTLGVRVSSHPIAQELAREVGGLITSTSANPASKQPPTALTALDPLLASQVDLVLDAGTLAGGLPSTVIFSRGKDIVLVRPGAITEDQLIRVVGHNLVIL